MEARIQPELNYFLKNKIYLDYGLETIHDGKFEQESRNSPTLTKVCKKVIIHMIFLCYNSHFVFHAPPFVCLLFPLYSSSPFSILIMCLTLFIFFSSICHSRCCSDLVGQPSVPSRSPFLEVIMNKDFWGFLFCF